MSLANQRAGTASTISPYDQSLLGHRRQLLRAARLLEHWGVLRRRTTEDRLLDSWAEAGAGIGVRVCENPSVVEAAAQALGAACPPLTCTYGRPSGAAWTLLRGLVAAGAAIVVSGDRDQAGQSISRDLIAGLPGASAWLPQAAGRYEEDRLPELLADPRPAASGS